MSVFGALPPFVCRLCGAKVAMLNPVRAAGAALPKTLIIPPGTYRFRGKSYRLEREGLYRFLLPAKENQQRIVYRRDLLALISGLCWMHSHGYREDPKSYRELMKQALTGKLIMTCGPFRNFVSRLLDEVGLKARPVNSLAASCNGHNDGHCLTEVVLDGRWALIDADQHTAFQHKGKRLTLLDMLSHVKKDDYTFERLALSVPLAVGNFTGANGYDYALWMETNIYSERTARAWYRHVMGAALIEGHCTTAGAKEFRALKRSRPSWKLNFLPPDEFKARFYGKISG